MRGARLCVRTLSGDGHRVVMIASMQMHRVVQKCSGESPQLQWHFHGYVEHKYVSTDRTVATTGRRSSPPWRVHRTHQKHPRGAFLASAALRQLRGARRVTTDWTIPTNR